MTGQMLRGGGLLPEGMESLVSLAAKQAYTGEELANLRTQVTGAHCLLYKACE